MSYRLDDGRIALPHCCVCDKTIQQISERQNLLTQNIEIVMSCHGKAELFLVDMADIWDNGRRTPISLPARVFLRNWAAFKTTTKLKRRVI